MSNRTAGHTATRQTGLGSLRPVAGRPADGSPNEPTPLVTWNCFDPGRARVAVTTRAGGVSTGRYASLNLGMGVGDDVDAVLTNRERAAAAFGARLDDVVFCQQVHARAVTVVGPGDRGRGARDPATALAATDAVVTTTPGVVLAVLVADCVPIVLHDPVAEVLAVVHAGWRGTVSGVTPAAVAAMVSAGARPADIVAGIGPCVSASRYQVGDEVAEAARDAFAGRGDVLRDDDSGRYLFDLAGAARIQLLDAGLAAAHVHDAGAVTGPGTPFYSHRFEGPTGRFAVLARLEPKGTP